MPKKRWFSTARDLLRKATSDTPGTSIAVRQGRRRAFQDEGTHSLFLWPVKALASLISGKGFKGRYSSGNKKVQEFLYDKWQRPLKNMDEKAGRVLARELDAKKLFRQVDVLPGARRVKGSSAKRPTDIVHNTYSATAPITKATKIVTPIAASLYAAEKLGGANIMATSEHPKALLKEAAEALETAHRQTEATKIAFAMVERGKVPPFENYDAFQEKVASLMERDLNVVREALALDVDMPDFGKVASQGIAPMDAHSAFYSRLVED